jgi:hypothetical protein
MPFLSQGFYISMDGQLYHSHLPEQAQRATAGGSGFVDHPLTALFCLGLVRKEDNLRER